MKLVYLFDLEGNTINLCFSSIMDYTDIEWVCYQESILRIHSSIIWKCKIEIRHLKEETIRPFIFGLGKIWDQNKNLSLLNYVLLHFQIRQRKCSVHPLHRAFRLVVRSSFVFASSNCDCCLQNNSCYMQKQMKIDLRETVHTDFKVFISVTFQGN